MEILQRERDRERERESLLGNITGTETETERNRICLKTLQKTERIKLVAKARTPSGCSFCFSINTEFIISWLQ